LTALAAKVRDEMARVRGIADLCIFPVLGQPDLDITVNRAEARGMGSTPAMSTP
jgi:cobalt-zinc-cadmium resistance protein CzcA